MDFFRLGVFCTALLVLCFAMKSVISYEANATATSGSAKSASVNADLLGFGGLGRQAGGDNSSIGSQKKRKDLEHFCAKPLIYLVGVRGLEPPTPCTPCKCATRLRHTPLSHRVYLGEVLSIREIE